MCIVQCTYLEEILEFWGYPNFCYQGVHYYWKGLKGMIFDHDFGYYFSLFSSLQKKREEEKMNELAKIVFKIHAFQTGPITV